MHNYIKIHIVTNGIIENIREEEGKKKMLLSH